ncbi:MAG TPA: class C sortase [Lachnospiraceae bacterium]|jgi:sortase A|nr:class C sortase [Lachnospiraceae bacterium]
MSGKKKRRQLKLLIIPVLMLGIAILCYPFISGYLNQKNQSRVVENYQETIGDMTDTDADSVTEEAEKFNRKLWEENGTVFGGYSSELSGLYSSELDEDGIMGYLSIPCIDITIPIRHGTAEDTLANACGHMEGSSLPVGGKNTHAVLTGHRGLPTSKLFTDLDQLKTGDKFYLHVFGRTLAYMVDQISTVLPGDVTQLGIFPDIDCVTLVTCTPYGINSHRLLIRGVRTTYEPEEENNTKSVRAFSGEARVTWLLIIGAVFAIFLMVLLIPAYYRRKLRKKG